MRTSHNVAPDKGNNPETASVRLETGNAKPIGEQANEASDIPSALSRAGNFTELAASWLRLMARDIEGFEHGMIVIKNDAQDAFVPIALWPNKPFDLHTLTLLAQSALKQHKSLESPTLDRGTGLKGFAIALPIDIEQTPFGAVVIRLRGDDRQAVARGKQLMQWGAGSVNRLAVANFAAWRQSYPGRKMLRATPTTQICVTRYFCESSFKGIPAPTSGKNDATAIALGCPDRPCRLAPTPMKAFRDALQVLSALL